MAVLTLIVLPAISIAATCGDTEVVDPKYLSPAPSTAAVPPSATGGGADSQLASANASPVATLAGAGDAPPAAGAAAGSAPAAAEVPTSTPVPPSPPPPSTVAPAPTATETSRGPRRDLPATAPAAPAGVPAANATPLSSLAVEEFDLINRFRQELGLNPLRGDAALNAEAAAYAKLMGDTNTFGHVGPDGSTAISRVAASGYSGAMCGEAIAAGQATAGAAFSTWRGSPEHSAIMFSKEADAVGIGYYFAPNSTYKHYWVLVTGKAASACAG